MHDAIFWNSMLDSISCIIIYHIISLLFTITEYSHIIISIVLLVIANMVTILIMIDNQKVTNSFNNLVGTSETLRIVSSPNIRSSDEDDVFNEWLSGIIDGGGCLLVSKEGYCSCEITMDKYDEHTLMSIKNKLGGSVKLRSGSNSFRYRLHNKNGMINLVNRINGNIRNSKRIPQLIKVCSILNITYMKPIPLTINNAWYSGFFDSDGTITAKFDNVSPTITISIANKEKIDVLPFLKFNGNVYYSKSGYGHYIWSISSRSDINNILDYFKKYPSRSHKMARLNLIHKFYSLRDIEAHKNTSLIHKRWEILKIKWSKWE